jgi:ligand-binding sensor domain-containing protein
MKKLIVLLSIFFTYNAQAQKVGIGQWQTYPSYQNATTIASIKEKIYCASENLYYYDTLVDGYKVYSKVNGLSDANIRFIKADEASNMLVIIYKSGNIDLLQNETITNIPDVKNLNVVGSKIINDVYFYNQLIYLSTDLGIVVINPAKNEIKETYPLQLGSNVAKVKSFAVFKDTLWAASDIGLFKIPQSNPVPQNFANWQLVSTIPFNYLTIFDNILFAATNAKVYNVNASNPVLIYSSNTPIIKLVSGLTSLYVLEENKFYNHIAFLNNLGIVTDSTNKRKANDLIEITPRNLWVADDYRGLIRIGDNSLEITRNPSGPFSKASYNINFSNNKLFYTSGEAPGWNYVFNGSGFSILENNDWRWLSKFYYLPQLNIVTDILNLVEDKRNETIYGACFGGGLMEMKKDLSVIMHKNNGFIESAQGDPGSCRLVDLQFDDANNLWMTMYGSVSQLVVKKAAGGWQKFQLPNITAANAASDLEIDDVNQKWIVNPLGKGVYVYNDNNTIDNPNDDKSIQLGTGKGNGNLPSGYINCLAKDKTGKIWVGSISGIGIFNNPESVFTSDGIDAELKVVKYDANAGLLFGTEYISTIAVDGANNKWIGTLNGVWQITDDAEKILQRFTKENSPLPSNEINKITIDPKTGTVYIATNEGMVSYRSNATDGADKMDNVRVFPNPVPSGYTQPIAIKGLVENADVRITDVSGQLVYKTKAQGGTATWNGLTYTNRRPQTGVYFVFISNNDGSETKVSKFIFNE